MSMEINPEVRPGGSADAAAETLEFLYCNDQLYEMRPARPEEFEDLWRLYLQNADWIATQEGSNGMWASPYGGEEKKRATMYGDVEAGNTYVAVDELSRLAASVTVTEDGPEMLWDEGQLSDSALYIKRLMRRHVDYISDQGLGKEMIQWAQRRAESSNKLWLRLDVWDTDERLLNYYARDCGFKPLASKIWANYPASRRFQRFVPGMAEKEVDLRSSNNVRAQQLIEAADPFGLVADLSPNVLERWRQGEYSDTETPLLMGSLRTGQFGLPDRRQLYYGADRHAAGLYRETIRSVQDIDESRDLELFSPMSLGLTMMAGYAMSPLLDRAVKLPQGPINLYDSLGTEQAALLANKLGLARFLASLRLQQSNDTEAKRGRQYLESVFRFLPGSNNGGRLWEWECDFHAIERPAVTERAYADSWGRHSGNNFAGPGVLVKGINQGGILYLEGDGRRIPLLNREDEQQARVVISPFASRPVVVDRCLRPFTATEFGFQPYQLKDGDMVMARIGLRPGRALPHADVLKVEG